MFNYSIPLTPAVMLVILLAEFVSLAILIVCAWIIRTMWKARHEAKAVVKQTIAEMDQKELGSQIDGIRKFLNEFMLHTSDTKDVPLLTQIFRPELEVANDLEIIEGVGAFVVNSLNGKPFIEFVYHGNPAADNE